MKQDKIYEALLVIVTGFLVLFFVFNNSVFLYVSVVVGGIGIFIKPLGKLIAKGWFLLGELMGFVVSKIILALLFYLFLTPIALLHNLFNKDILRIRKTPETLWHKRDYNYKEKDFKNIW
jgi:hypothetical protein